MIDLEIKAEIVRAGALSVTVEMLYGGRAQFRSDVTGMERLIFPQAPAVFQNLNFKNEKHFCTYFNARNDVSGDSTARFAMVALHECSKCRTYS